MNAIMQCKICKRVFMVDLGKWIVTNGHLLEGLKYVICPDCDKK